MLSASLDDLDDLLFTRDYLPTAVAPEIIKETRERWNNNCHHCDLSLVNPHIGLLLLGCLFSENLPPILSLGLRAVSTYRWNRVNRSNCRSKRIARPNAELLHRLDDLLAVNIRTATDIKSGVTDVRQPEYPMVSLQQLTRNAVMHRDYQTTSAPVRITWFNDRIEIQNPGGPFGQVTRNNFGSPGITDYRNPHLAEALKSLGFVQRFG